MPHLREIALRPGVSTTINWNQLVNQEALLAYTCGTVALWHCNRASTASVMLASSGCMCSSWVGCSNPAWDATTAARDRAAVSVQVQR